jgi:thiol-disulfide isomerase/thioredoxin
MAVFRSWFITPYLVANALVCLVAVWFVAHGSFAWLGIVAATAPVMYLTGGNVVFHHSASSSRYLPIPSLVTGLGVIWTVAWSIAGPWNLAATSAAVLAGGGYLAYLLWYSSFGRRAAPALATGQPLPEFEVFTSGGVAVSSRTLVGAPALVLFYRGNWCPFCVTQIREVAAAYRDLDRRGVKVVLISPQAEEKSVTLAGRFDVPMTFWTDRCRAPAWHPRRARPAGRPRSLGLRPGHRLAHRHNDRRPRDRVLQRSDRLVPREAYSRDVHRRI